MDSFRSEFFVQYLSTSDGQGHRWQRPLHGKCRRWRCAASAAAIRYRPLPKKLGRMAAVCYDECVLAPPLRSAIIANVGAMALTATTDVAIRLSTVP